MKKLKKIIKKSFLFPIIKKSSLYPYIKNPIGKTPWQTTKFREILYGINSFAQQGEDLTLDRILLRKLELNLDTYKGFYVDAGAFHPISHSTTYLLYKRGWKGVCIDISQKSCALIKKVRPRDLVINTATSDFDGELFFEEKETISLGNFASNKSNGTVNKVPALQLTTILKNNNINRKIDYLNIDTEGAELETLKGLDFNVYEPKVISVEIHSLSIESGLKSEVAAYLYSMGYHCVASNVITFFFIKKQITK